MALRIPTTVGLISFALAGSACSDAHKLAKAYEKVCKARCECEPQTEYWDEVKNCKLSCEGQATSYKASYNEEFADEEPCDEVNDYIKDLKACAKEHCHNIDLCVSEVYSDLSECLNFGGYYYGLSSPEHEARAIREELTSQMLYGPWPLVCESGDDDRSVLCDHMGLTE